MYLLAREIIIEENGVVMDKKTIIERIEEYAPLHVQASWDSSGIQIESVKNSFSHVAVMLDPSVESIEKALAMDCDFLISHHPLSMLDYRLNKVNALFKISSMLLSKQALLYSAHTSLDVTKHKEKSSTDSSNICHNTHIDILTQNSSKPDAFHDTLYDYYDNLHIMPFVSKWLADELSLKNIQALDKKDNFGVVGTLEKAITIPKLAKKLVQLMPNISLKDFRLIALDQEEAKKREIKTIAICTGSGASLYEHALLSQADLYITGDVKYHDALDALQAIPNKKNPPLLLDVGHFSLEEEMMRRFSLLLEDDFKEKNIKVSFIKANNPYSYF